MKLPEENKGGVLFDILLVTSCVIFLRKTWKHISEVSGVKSLISKKSKQQATDTNSG